MPRLSSYHVASAFGSLARKKNPPIPSTRSMPLAPSVGVRTAQAAAAAPAIATRIAVRRVTSVDLFTPVAPHRPYERPLRYGVLRSIVIAAGADRLPASSTAYT